MLALLHELCARSRAGGFSGDVRLVHICRDAGDQIFASELRELAKDWPALQIIHWHSARAGRPTPEALLTSVPDYAERDTWLCGPAAFMADIESHSAAQGISDRLRLDSLRAAPPQLHSGETSERPCAHQDTNSPHNTRQTTT